MYAFFARLQKIYPLIGLLFLFILYGCGGSGGGSSVATATAISAGNGRSCALLPTGSVLRCWGIVPNSNTTTTTSSNPTSESGITTAAAISVSDASGHTCALITGGTVQCWGSNANGQLGNGTTTDSLSTPVAVSGITTATAISAGGYHTCALLTDGTVQCWGLNANGQLGNGTTTSPLSTPVAVTGITTAIAISAGGDQTCALLSGGAVQCWGANSNGQLGNGTIIDSSIPVAVTGITTAAAISAGGEQTCALITGGTVQCWGLNNFGQLGNASTTSSPIPVAVSGITNAAAVSAGGNHTCALLSTTTVQCWGLNNTGQLGNGLLTGSMIPVPVYYTLTSVLAISAGVDQTCALVSAGAIQCWGLNNFGQLGNGQTTDSAIPVAVNGF